MKILIIRRIVMAFWVLATIMLALHLYVYWDLLKHEPLLPVLGWIGWSRLFSAIYTGLKNKPPLAVHIHQHKAVDE